MIEFYTLFFADNENKEFAAFAKNKTQLRRAIENNIKSDFMTFGPPDKKKHEQIRSLREFFSADPDVDVINRYLHFGIIEKAEDGAEAEKMVETYKGDIGKSSFLAEENKQIIFQHRQRAIQEWRKANGKPSI